MSQITWSANQTKRGLSHGVLYLDDGAHPWNGLVSVEEMDTSQIDTELYYEGRRHRFAQDTGYFTANVEAYTYPASFNKYDGLDDHSDGQSRERFGFSYRVGDIYDYDLHLVYNALVYPMPMSASTLSQSADISPFKWTMISSGTELTWTKRGAHLVVSKAEAHPQPFAELESYIYGTSSTDAYLPTSAQVIEMFESRTELRVDYNGDGTYTATGPGYMITEPEMVMDEETEEMVSNGIIKINNQNAFDVYGDGTYIMRSHWEGG